MVEAPDCESGYTGSIPVHYPLSLAERHTRMVENHVRKGTGSNPVGETMSCDPWDIASAIVLFIFLVLIAFFIFDLWRR